MRKSQILKKILSSVASTPKLSILSHQKPYDVMGYASHNIDIQWILTTLQKLANDGLKVCFCCSYGEIQNDYLRALSLSNIDTYQNVDSQFIQKIKAPLVLTATSSLPKSFFSKKYCKWRVHVPHSICSLHMIYPEDAFDGYNVLFGVGPHHTREFEALSLIRNIENRHVYECGYGKIKLMRNQKIDTNKDPKQEKTILIAPSWGKGNFLEEEEIPLIKELIKTQYKIIVRPHPSFFIEENPALKNLYKIIHDHKEVIIEDSRDISIGITEADLLITDYSGIAQEFTILNSKPVLFIDGPLKVLNPNWKKFPHEPIELMSRGKIGPIISAKNYTDIKDVITKIFEQDLYWRDKIETFKKEFYCNLDFEKTASERIYKLLDKQKK